MTTIIRIPYDTMRQEFGRVFRKVGFSAEDAEQVAEIMTMNSADGVESHGYFRLLNVVKAAQTGTIKPDAVPEKINSFGAWEQWDGMQAPGILNALFCTDRVMELASEHGIGCVALRNTNHWLRPGAYGWKAAQAGYIFMCWTNTEPLVPIWGGTDLRIGNNPIVMAVPRPSGPLVLDIAMTQFSFGKLSVYAHRDQTLPVPGGYDVDGNPTQDPHAIQEANRALPIGYWKGSGLALMMDLIGGLMSGGNSTVHLGSKFMSGGVSQMYLAFDITRAMPLDSIEAFVNETLDYVKSSAKANPDQDILYPGERALKARQDSLANGVPVDEAIWAEIQAF